jgi:hypothetical protein
MTYPIFLSTRPRSWVNPSSQIGFQNYDIDIKNKFIQIKPPLKINPSYHNKKTKKKKKDY